MPFGNGMSVPLELSLRRAGEQTRLCFYPVKEIDGLRIATSSIENVDAEKANGLLAEFNSELLDIEIVLQPKNNQPVVLDVRGYPIVYASTSRQVAFAGEMITCQPDTGKLHLRLLIDRSITEVFVDYGWGAFASMTIFSDLRPLRLEGAMVVERLTVHHLKPIWA
jgi:sucrose-6-phosphate hydrolase SacC (GH32 family)